MRHEALLYSLDHNITKEQLQQATDIPYDKNKYAKLLERVEQEKVQAIITSEHHFCERIRHQTYILYYLGDIDLLSKSKLGIVGPRKMSSYGEKVLNELFMHMCEYDIVTLSGMADGVDMLCHKLSIAQGIPTIAVLGGGIGRYFKRPEWMTIQNIVAAGGLVVSQFRLGDSPASYTFPQRNRIIAGLADLLFLPEAGKKSGSLITVDFALAMKTPVFATPNSIFSPTSEGILQLMESGHVKPVVDFKRFLHQHFITKNVITQTKIPLNLSDEEKTLLSLLSYDDSVALPSLVRRSGNDIDKLVQLLTMLEIKGIVIQERPGEYMLV